MDKIDTPDDRRTLIFSIIAAVIAFLIAWAWTLKKGGSGGFGYGLVCAAVAAFFVWASHLWIDPFWKEIRKEIQEWIEHG